MAQVYNNIDEHGSDAECSNIYHQQRQIRCSVCCSGSEYQKQPNLAHVRTGSFIVNEHDSNARVSNNSLFYNWNPIQFSIIE